MAMMTPKEHIDHIRKTKFSIGSEPNPLTEDLHQSVKNLSAELYSKDAHFLMEIIQNAEDNVYDEGVKPSLEFIITSQDITRTGANSTLLVFNNEKGFSPKNIESISSVGRSTKKGQRQQGYIGEKGIGFKSVFLITAQPCIFSNGYQIRFNEEADPYCNLGYIVPEWIEENPTLGDIKSIYGSNNKSLPTTIIVLPLKHDKEQVVKLQLSSIHPEVLLFLSKIRQLSVREDNKDTKLNTVSAISISSETEFVSRKNVSAESYTLHLSAEEDCDDGERECSYYMWRQKFPVNQENRVERRMEVDDLVITLAFPNGKRLNRGRKLPGIYAFLPTEMVTNFPFIIQADFLLASSREEILHDNKWNIGILNCVPSAFVNAFVSLVKTSGAAPVSSLARMFEFLPVDSSSYIKLNIVRDSIKSKLLEENIVPSESYTAQKLFHKPSEVGRIVPAFWDILIKAREEGMSLHNLSSHGTYALNSAFDIGYYDDILDFLEVKYMDCEWYGKCIQSSNLVLGLSEDVYLELLFFIADNWTVFQLTNMKGIRLLKYVGQEGQVNLGSVNKVTKWRVRKLCLLKSARHISWLIDWNKEFRCAPCYFMPNGTQEAFQSFREKTTLKKWLSDHVEASFVTVNNYADLLLNSLSNERRLVVVFAHFLYQSLSKKYVSQSKVEILCKKMPLLDNYACVTTQKSGVLIPANGSKWAGLIRSNPWRGKNYVELGEDYLHAGNYAGEYTSKEEILNFLKTHVQASDIPDLCPPDDAFPAVSSPLTKENTFFLLEWIRNLKRKEMLVDGNFLRCIKLGSWLRTYVGNSVGYRPPSLSFLLTPSWGNILKDGSEMVDIPLIDQQFYDNRILDYKDELITIGVMTEFGEVCQFIGKRLMSLAANGSLTRANVFSILNFIKFLREKYLPPDDFVKSVKEGHWLRTSCGEQSPVGAILFESEWNAASKISNLPFIDEEYYGTQIQSFRTELQLLGVVVGFDRNYQRLANCFRMPTNFTSMTWDDISLILECIRHSSSSDQLVGILKSKQWLKTTEGFKYPSECFLFDSDWGCLLRIFPGFPVISEKSYGDQVFSYKNELKKLGVVVDFEEAAKQFSRRFKELASSGSITKDNVLLFLECYRTLKKTSHQFPLELENSIREEKWLHTRLGQKSPKESILFSSDWEYLAPIALLPFIDDSEVSYGTAIREYKKELKAIGVVVEFNMGSKFVAAGLYFPLNPTDIAPSSVRSLLECIRYIMKDQGDSLPEEFLGRANKRWLKTYMGYRKPNECLLFGSEWKSLLQCNDASFIDDRFYGFDVTSYKKELNAIGVIVDVKNGCQLLADQLQCHSKYDVIARIYMYLSEYDWKPKNEASNWIWIPSGNDGVHWVSPEVCVLYDKDALFGLQLNVLDKYYEKKLLAFFSMALDVRQNPSVDDYLRLWKTWENSEYQLTPAECCAFWKCIVKHCNSKTKGLLAEMVKLPVTRDADIILLVNKQDVFIPDDLLLVDLFEKSSPDPIFIWYPQPSSPTLPRTKLHEIYGSIGVQPISKSVQRTELSTLDVEVKEVTPREVLIKRGLIRLVLGFLSDPSIDMDANKRQSSVKALLDVNVLMTEEVISVSYTLSLASGKSINVKACEMIRWERESSKMFIQKISNLSGQKARCQFVTYFSKVIAEGLLWEKEDRIAELSDLIKLGWLLKFEEEEIEFLLKSKNLQIFMEDEEFLESAFTAE